MSKEFLGYAIIDDGYPKYHIYECYKIVTNEKISYKAEPLFDHESVETIRTNKMANYRKYNSHEELEELREFINKIKTEYDNNKREKQVCANCISSLYAED